VLLSGFAGQTLLAGSLSLTAKATDDKGTATVSAPIAIQCGLQSQTIAPRKHHGFLQQRPVFTQGEQHQHHCKRSRYRRNITKSGFFNGNICWEQTLQLLTAWPGQTLHLKLFLLPRQRMIKEH